MLYSSIKTIAVLWFAPYISHSSCSVIAQLPIPLFGHQLGYGNDPNIIFLFGGQTTQFKDIDFIYKWNITAPNTFIKLPIATPTSPFRSYCSNAVSLNDRIYFIGIDDGSSGVNYVFDTITETWLDNTNISSLPYPAIYSCLTSNTTHIFFIGGQLSNRFEDHLQVYNINDNIWFAEQIDIAPIKDQGWAKGYCEFVNEYLYIFGGSIAANNPIDNIFKWNLKWNNVGVLPTPQAQGRSIHIDYNIYLIGGTSIYEFNTNTDTITNVYNIQSLYNIAAGIINNKLYVFGGGYNSAPISDVQMCDIIQSSTPTISPSTTPTTIDPTTTDPTTIKPTTTEPSTMQPTTSEPTTHEPTTRDPTSQPTSQTTTLEQNGQTTTSKYEVLTTQNVRESINMNVITDNVNKETSLMLIILIFINVIVGAVICVVLIIIGIYFYRKRNKVHIPPQNAKRMNSASIVDNEKSTTDHCGKQGARNTRIPNDNSDCSPSGEMMQCTNNVELQSSTQQSNRYQQNEKVIEGEDDHEESASIDSMYKQTQGEWIESVTPGHIVKNTKK